MKTMLNVVEKVAKTYATRGEIRMSNSEAELVDLIEGYIKAPPETSVVLTFTPKVAEYVLKVHNVENRAAKPRKIIEFAADMTDALWKLTGDTVKFSGRPLLRDGQNRLFACVRSGKPFKTHVVFGVDDASFPWMDLGKRRNGGDALAILGVANSPVVSGMVRWLELFRTDRVKERGSLSPQETIEAYERSDSALIEEALVAARRVYAADETPRTLAGALYYQFAGADHELAAEFFEAWATRNFGGRMKPVKKASEYLARLYAASNGRVHDVVRAAVWVIAWNFVVARRIGTAPDFKWKPESPFPRISKKRES
ncbi:hypothetical protein [Bradyrhizobium japonicum]|uniref:hypothetical protein n=1 Tax=Bradyrhizobium japonicum TaxID=375 RepID=UPI001E54D64E|nr:hypothetical protein [Bradyrhizobium japonicum]MCD9821160.1 hypothetical protein [Bradyrhizobium japonicum]MEB2674143.1 hypothetical protein [Bradyrhizobium japonicum]WRI93329.1 hypothetical protein R3F75_21295 [Bradyrhizobium japonicum]